MKKTKNIFIIFALAIIFAFGVSAFALESNKDNSTEVVVNTEENQEQANSNENTNQPEANNKVDSNKEKNDQSDVSKDVSKSSNNDTKAVVKENNSNNTNKANTKDESTTPKLGIAATSILTLGTAPFDSNEGPGTGNALVNSPTKQVRVNDYVTYHLELVSNEARIYQPQLTIDLPKGMSMATIPTFCDSSLSTLEPANPYANVTWPIDGAIGSGGTTDSQVQTQTLTCMINPGAGVGSIPNVTKGLDLQVKLSNLLNDQTNIQPASLSFTGNAVDKDDSTNVPAVSASSSQLDSLQVTAAAALKWNLSINGISTSPNSTVYQGPKLTEKNGVVYNAITLPITISSPVDNGKGVMPIVGDISWDYNLAASNFFPSLNPQQIQEINSNPDKYGAIVDGVVKSPGAIMALPKEKLTGASDTTVNNSVINSGAITNNPAYTPNTTIKFVSSGTDWSLKSSPITGANNIPLQQLNLPSGKSVIPSYSLSKTFNVYVPKDTLSEFGNENSNGLLKLLINNKFTNFKINGFKNSVTQNPEQQSSNCEGNFTCDPDLLYREIPLSKVQGSTPNKMFTGVPGEPNQSSAIQYNAGNLIGPPSRSVVYKDFTVAPGQFINSSVNIPGPLLGEKNRTVLVCDTWDNSKLQLRSADIPGINTNAQYIGSNNSPAWLSGVTSNGKSLSEEVINSKIKYKFQYASVNFDDSTNKVLDCGNNINNSDITWHDNAADVEGNNPELLAQGIYSSVNKVRVFADVPASNVFGDNSGNAVLYAAISQRVNPEYQVENGIIGNWITSYINDESISFEQLLNSVNEGSIIGNIPNLNLNNNAGGQFDKARLALSQTRINKEVALQQEQSNGETTTTAYTKSAPNATFGDKYLFKLSPTLVNNVGNAGLYDNNIMVEDCLPQGLTYESATSGGKSFNPSIAVTAPNSTTAPTVPTGGEITSCGIGETYLRWTYPTLEINKNIDPIVMTSLVKYDAVNHASFTNTATISSELDHSPLNLRQSQASGGFNLITGVAVNKVLLTPVVQVNRNDDTNTNYQNMAWDNITFNASNHPIGITTMVDRLPNIVDNGSYHGTLKAISVSQNSDSKPYTLYYSTDTNVEGADQSKYINVPNPAVNWTLVTDCSSTNVCTIPEDVASNVTALMYKSVNTMEAGDIMSGEVQLIGIGNEAGDQYKSSVSAVADELTSQVGPITVPVNVISSSVGDKVWYNLPADGLQGQQEGATPGLNPGAKDVSVNLSGTDDLGNTLNLNTKTNADGNYMFDTLRSGNYTVTVVKPDNESINGFTYQYDENRDPDADPANASAVIATSDLNGGTNANAGTVNFDLAVNTQDIDKDAGLLVTGSLQIKKLLEGKGVESYAVGDKLEFSVSCQLNGVDVNSTNFPQFVNLPDLSNPLTFTVQAGQSEWTSEKITNIPVGSICTATETNSGNATGVIDNAQVTIGFDENTASGANEEALITNMYEASDVYVAKKLEGEGASQQTGNYFDINITCVLTDENNQVTGTVFEGPVSVLGGSTQQVLDINGKPVVVPVGSKCYGEETNWGSANKHEVDYNSLENAIEVLKGQPSDLQKITITATNTFDKKPVKPTKPTTPTNPAQPVKPLPQTGNNDIVIVSILVSVTIVISGAVWFASSRKKEL